MAIASLPRDGGFSGRRGHRLHAHGPGRGFDDLFQGQRCGRLTGGRGEEGAERGGMAFVGRGEPAAADPGGEAARPHGFPVIEMEFPTRSGDRDALLGHGGWEVREVTEFGRVAVGEGQVETPGVLAYLAINVGRDGNRVPT